MATTAAVAALALIVLAAVTGIWPFTRVGNSDASQPGDTLTKFAVDDAVADDRDDLTEAVFELRSLAFRDGESTNTAAARTALLDEFGTDADGDRRVRITTSSLDAMVNDAIELHDLEAYPAPGYQGKGIVASSVEVTTTLTYLREDRPTLFVVAAETWTWDDAGTEVESGQVQHWDAPFAEQGDLWVVGDFEPEPEAIEQH